MIFSMDTKINEILNKIYYSYYRNERVFYPWGKGSFSVTHIWMICLGIEVLLMSVLTCLLCLFLSLFPAYEHMEIFPTLFYFVGFALIERYIRKHIWSDVDEELQQKYRDEHLNSAKWSLIGIIVEICAYICLFLGIILLLISLGLYSIHQ